MKKVRGAWQQEVVIHLQSVVQLLERAGSVDPRKQYRNVTALPYGEQRSALVLRDDIQVLKQRILKLFPVQRVKP